VADINTLKQKDLLRGEVFFPFTAFATLREIFPLLLAALPH
jgi:hypothetical protein